MSERFSGHEGEPPAPITIYDLAVHRMTELGLYTPETLPERLSGADFNAVGLDILGGCGTCGASIAAYNACPSTTGYWLCASGCIDDIGFPSAEQANEEIFGGDDVSG